MASPKKWSVVIADDEPASRHGLIVLCSAHARLRVVGETGSARVAGELCRKLRPDLLIVDPEMDGGEGLALIKALLRSAKTTRTVAFARLAEPGRIERALRAGALGYGTRYEEEAELVKLLIAVADGKQHLSPRASEVVAHGLSNGTVRVSDDALAALSTRERQVFAWLGAGLGTREVAEKCGVSVKTVESHLEHLKLKLALRSGLELRKAAVGVRQGGAGECVVGSGAVLAAA